jgi:hypothetical protein
LCLEVFSFQVVGEYNIIILRNKTKKKTHPLFSVNGCSNNIKGHAKVILIRIGHMSEVYDVNFDYWLALRLTFCMMMMVIIMIVIIIIIIKIIMSVVLLIMIIIIIIIIITI